VCSYDSSRFNCDELTVWRWDDRATSWLVAFTSYLCPSLEAFRQFVKQMIMNWMLIKFVVVVDLLHTVLVWIEKVQRNHVDVEKKKSNQYPRRPLEKDTNYQTLKHGVPPSNTNSVRLFSSYTLRKNEMYQYHAHFHIFCKSNKMPTTTLCIQTAYRDNNQWLNYYIIYETLTTICSKISNYTKSASRPLVQFLHVDNIQRIFNRLSINRKKTRCWTLVGWLSASQW